MQWGNPFSTRFRYRSAPITPDIRPTIIVENVLLNDIKCFAIDEIYNILHLMCYYMQKLFKTFNLPTLLLFYLK